MSPAPRARGGKREGAGRPRRVPGEDVVRVTVRLSASEVATLDALAVHLGTNRSGAIRWLLTTGGPDAFPGEETHRRSVRLPVRVWALIDALAQKHGTSSAGAVALAVGEHAEPVRRKG